MLNPKRILFLVALFSLLAVGNVIAQTGEIFGQVKSSKGEPLSGANVTVQGTLLGTSTDAKGEFRLTNLKEGKYVIQITMVGYIIFISDEIPVTGNRFEMNASLTETVLQYDPVIITAGKREQSLSELPVSAAILNADLLSSKNIIKIDEALRYVPGVHVNFDQISIRGSSGYSRGAGSRVLMAIDGVPLYSGDTGELVWEMIPVADIERVEVIKGPASSLYGSTAIGGVVNIITKKNTSNSLTYISCYAGLYDEPAHSEWKWSDKTRTFNGITIGHSNSIGKLGYSASITRTFDMSYKRENDARRFSGYLKTNFFFSELSSLTLFAAGYTHSRGNFNFWKNSRNALVPPDADLGWRVDSDRIVAAAIFNSSFSDAVSYKILGSLYSNHWSDKSENNNAANSNLYRIEVQTKYSPQQNLTFIGGVEAAHSDVNSDIFTSPTANSAGVFLQAENKFSFPLTLTAGLRFDYSSLDTIKNVSAISPKLGLNYKFNKSTILRASFGTGFRAPTLAELFTSTSLSGISVRPNPVLKSESNFSIEAGVNQNFLKIFVLDASIFQTEYFDLIEPRLTARNGVAFIIFDNVTRARIQGTDLSITANLPDYNLKLSSSYTYLWARDLDLKRALRYRPRNTIYASAEFSPGILTFGADFRFWTRVEEVDRDLIERGIVKDGDKRVDVYVTDLRAGFSLIVYEIPIKIMVNANNIFNYNYIELIGNISPIRNISLNLQLLF